MIFSKVKIQEVNRAKDIWRDGVLECITPSLHYSSLDFFLPIPSEQMSRSFRRFFDKPDFADGHLAVDRFAHIVDRETGDRNCVMASISTPVLPLTRTVASISTRGGLFFGVTSISLR
jgi:hypothetical protein